VSPDQTLADNGIEPLGAESVDTNVWVQYKEVDPFLVEEEVAKSSDGDQPLRARIAEPEILQLADLNQQQPTPLRGPYQSTLQYGLDNN
jgi:hypothetical protein